MHGDAAGWQEGREVTVSVEPDAWCRTGPPPGSPRTCEASWPGGSGDVSDRYGGPRPETGEQVTARIVGDDLTLTGYSRILLGVGAAGAVPHPAWGWSSPSPRPPPWSASTRAGGVVAQT